MEISTKLKLKIFVRTFWTIAVSIAIGFAIGAMWAYEHIQELSK